MSSSDRGSDNEEGFGLDEAYSVETPDDSRRLYAKWSASYDFDFIAHNRYVYHQHVVDALLTANGSDLALDGAILDVGCGTGVVGGALRALVPNPIDGIDISPEMMSQAATKHGDDGVPIYRSLIEADLTKQTSLGTDSYAAIISTGTFTHGHLGPEPIDELLRVAAPGACCAIGVNAEHWKALSFDKWFASRAADGRITDFKLVDVPIYAADSGEHANDRANVALFRVL